jgi:glycosyltransferase involved in cell wall biosynthesis
MKPKLLFISTLPCEPTTGGKIQLYRHLVESNDFHLEFIQESNVRATNYLETGIPPIDSLLQRSSKTRFFPDLLAFNHLMAEWRHDKRILETATRLQPDAIVTVAYGSYSFIAASIARQLKIPLITFFHDWWPDLTLCRGWTKSLLDRRFRHLHRESSLALCVSELMHQELGAGKQSQVLYPIPGQRSAPKFSPPHPVQTRQPFKIVYLGVLTGHHGASLQALARALIHPSQNPFQLELYGSARDWPKELTESAQACGLYQGEQYGEGVTHSILKDADAFLVVMSFTESQKRFVRTSFPSKILEYAAYGKPIIAWGPENCSAIQFLQKHQAGVTITSPDPVAVIRSFSELAQHPARQLQLSKAAHELAFSIFDPQVIHQQFLNSVYQVLQYGHNSSFSQ